MFNIVQFFGDHQIDYSLSGNNVMDGWVNICCPFCDDHSNHLGVFLKKPANVRCWRCGKHTLPNLLAQFSDKKPKTLYSLYSLDGDEEIPDDEGDITEKTILSHNEVHKLFTQNSSPSLMGNYARYLLNRKFNISIKNEWGVQGGIEMGDYRYRLMIPVIHRGKMVSFQGRDITDKQDVKYMTCEDTQINNYLYGLDDIADDRVIITEGAMDVWRLGRGNAVATFGIEYSAEQLVLLLKHKIKHAIVFFDSEPQAMSAATTLIGELELLDINVKNITIAGKDPANLTKEEAIGIVKYLANM
ncbi:hypothetical protein HN682_06815 [Candidatus Peregrinibacteria bacterium]|jgi:hypothetical protein|nr:hypothetical protein [Candidatus Peregrinibacteria bacterium]